jgi:hypothetical protein
MMLSLKLKALLSSLVSIFNVTIEGEKLTMMVRSEEDAQTLGRWLEFGKFGSTPVICRGPKLERHQYWLVSSEAQSNSLKVLTGNLK